MILISAILILSAIVGGLAILVFGYSEKSIMFPRIFGGAFLFTITITHILPEIFQHSNHASYVSVFLLFGFFFQQLLEHFTSGIEHGHFHKSTHPRGRYGLVTALIIHSILEGSILVSYATLHEGDGIYPLLLGIVLHKFPAAFALMAFFKTGANLSRRQIAVLIIFSLASPLGLIVSEYFISLSQDHFIILYALVGGSFLHISSTIFIESSPDHHFKWKKFLVGVSGALVALVGVVLF